MGITGSAGNNNQGAADKEEILCDLKRIQENNHKNLDNPEATEKVSPLHFLLICIGQDILSSS